MQLKKLGFLTGCLLLIVVTFLIGYAEGKNKMVRAELNVSIPIHVDMYHAIKQNDTNRATTLIGMLLIGKLDRYDSLEKNSVFRATAGSDLFTSAKLQNYVRQARDIVTAERTNLITILPPK